jgi:hypothetical protein
MPFMQRPIRLIRPRGTLVVPWTFLPLFISLCLAAPAAPGPQQQAPDQGLW